MAGGFATQGGLDRLGQLANRRFLAGDDRCEPVLGEALRPEALVRHARVGKQQGAATGLEQIRAGVVAGAADREIGVRDVAQEVAA